MDKLTVSEQLLNEICNTDSVVKSIMNDVEVKNHVITELSKSFENIVKDYPQLVDDIIKRIIKYHKRKVEDFKITDFVQLVGWYSISLPDHPIGWWNANGKYYGLRMDEVINMFLIAKDF